MNKINCGEYPILSVHTFGKFQVSNENGILTVEKIHSEMLTRLLTYMIYHRDKSLTVQELVETLWPDDESDNPAGALKNLMYRLRNLLKKTWGDYDFITTGRGVYRWNSHSVLKVDAEEFEQFCREMDIESNIEKKIEKGKAAVELYQGVFLPELSAEYWVIATSTYLNSIYLSTVKKLAKLLEHEQRYPELEQLCRQVLRFESLDEEIHCYLLRALIADNKQQAAAEHYTRTVKYMYDALGVRPSEEMQEIYEEMQKRQYDYESSIDIIQEDLKEKELPTGAFLCEYGVFKKIYALEARSSKRMGISIHLALVSMYLDLRSQEPQSKHKNILSEGMNVLEKTLLGGLRNSDIICRYSANQFLIMLPACQYEDAKMVVNRLKDRFYQSGKTKKVILQYNIDEINIM